MSLEDELNIPQEATLTLPPHLQPVELIISNITDDISTNFITIPSSATTNNQTNNSSHKVQITNASSIRNHANTNNNNNNIPRCIIIGRQASASDIRIDHKSVSRRHTALYYITASPSTTNTNNNNANNNNSNIKLIIQDLGGKHGTYVNDTRLSKNGTFSINLSTLSTAEYEYRIRIGNAPLLCNLIIKPEIDIDTTKKMDEETQKCGEKKSVKKDTEQNTEDVAVDYDRKEPPEGQSIDKQKALPKENNKDEALTRESREEQIAAMIASFDTAPAYKKYIPRSNDEEDNDDNVTRGMNNLKTDGKVSMKNEGMATSSTNNTNNNNPYNLPITSSITLSPGSNSFTSSDGTNTPLQSKSSVSTLCFEPSGARLVAGHRDGTLRFYDFHGMQPTRPQTAESNNTTYPPFRIVDSDNDPLDQTGRHIMTALSPSATGGQWIVGNTSAQAKVLDREGQTTLYYFIKGDVYVTDPTKTTGHTASVTGVAFHPLIKDICWTTGLDGSIRQWDTSGKGRTQFQKLVCKSVIGKVKNDKGQRTQVVSNLSVHPNGRKLVIGTSCGSIQIWNCYGVNVNVNRPLGVVYSAHSGKGVTFVTFSGGNGEYIASRSDSDDTVRIWNVSRMEKDSGLFTRKHNSRGSGGKGGGEVEHSPSLLLAVCVGLPALNEFANCAFSPDGSILCAGTSVDPRKSGSDTDTCGKLKFYQLPEDNVKRIKGSKSKEGGSKSSSKKNKKTTAMLDPIVELDVAPNASVLGVQWHPKLNQIAFGTSNGIIQVLYDPILSNKGALLPASRTVRKSDGLSDLLLSRAPTGSAAYLSSANNTIMNPHSLPLFREEPKATKKMKDNDRKDPEKTKMPEAPISGGTRHSRIKTGAQVGGGTTFIQHTLEATNYNNNKNIAGKDPREELFKYSEGKSYVSKAYEGDVQRILAEKTVEEEEADLKGGNSSKRQRTK